MLEFSTALPTVRTTDSGHFFVFRHLCRSLGSLWQTWHDAVSTFLQVIQLNQLAGVLQVEDLHKRKEGHNKQQIFMRTGNYVQQGTQAGRGDKLIHYLTSAQMALMDSPLCMTAWKGHKHSLHICMAHSSRTTSMCKIMAFNKPSSELPLSAYRSGVLGWWSRHSSEKARASLLLNPHPLVWEQLFSGPWPCLPWAEPAITNPQHTLHCLLAISVVSTCCKTFAAITWL